MNNKTIDANAISSKTNVDLRLTIGSFAAVILIGVLAVLYPDTVKSSMSVMLDFTVLKMGSAFLWYTLFATVLLLYLAFSKFGNIRLGGAKPKFSKFQLFAMGLSAGMGASTMYWAFIESIYYYMDPQFGIIDKAQAMEYATAYNIFHWGAAGWMTYLLVAVPFALVFYLKKNNNISLSGVANSLFDGKIPLPIQKLLDFLFILTTLAATALTLGLAIPMISANVSQITGISESLYLGIGIILGLSLIFTCSSYIGIEKGMARISSATIYISVLLVCMILVVGPTALIINNTTNGLGIALSEYIRMSTNTDPFGNTYFPQYWTVFFLANWISYSPGVGVFIIKIAKGHKLRDVLIYLAGAGTLGTSIIFGVCGTYSMDLMNTGAVDAVSLIQAGNPTELVTQIFNSSPTPIILTSVYLVCLILFCVTTLDGTSFSLAGITTRKLDNNANVSPVFRLFWCLLLTLVPIVFLLINANLNIFKSFPVLIVVPMMPIFTVLGLKALGYVKKEFGELTPKEIEQHSVALFERDMQSEKA